MGQTKAIKYWGGKQHKILRFWPPLGGSLYRMIFRSLFNNIVIKSLLQQKNDVIFWAKEGKGEEDEAEKEQEANNIDTSPSIPCPPTCEGSSAPACCASCIAKASGRECEGQHRKTNLENMRAKNASNWSGQFSKIFISEWNSSKHMKWNFNIFWYWMVPGISQSPPCVVADAW